MTYQEAMNIIEDSKRYGSVLGLNNIRTLLEKLGNPQNQLQIIHIGGTNGKGSTAAYISSILAVAGYKIGRYSSPVVFEYRECIQIMKQRQETIITEYIEEEAVARQMERISAAIKEMLENGLQHPTTFEIETAMSFLYFLEQQCSVVVLEVGMGGALDATNVIDQSLCSVVTSISMDHMQFLGNDIETITKEKAAILKNNGLAVCYDYENDRIEEAERGKRIASIIQMTAKEKNVIVAWADFKEIKSEEHSLQGIVFSYKNNENLKLNLLGENQVKNAVLAIEVVNCLNKSGKLKSKIEKAHIYKGLEMTKWRGRFSVISKRPLIIADGAHNEGAAKSLAKSLELYLHKKKCIFVVGMFADKEYNKVLKVTAPYAEVIITITPNNVRALPSEQLAECAETYCTNVIDGKTIEEGLEKAYELSKCKIPIITFGSLSFIKEVYAFTERIKR